MRKFNLESMARDQMARAKQSPSGRAATTVFGGSESMLRQTVIALVEGTELAEHDNPGDATVFVLSGRIRLIAGEDAWEGRDSNLLAVPNARHSLTALTDAAVVLTVAKERR